jgi:hypothetical protein
MFKKITAVQYNWLMSMIDYIVSDIPKHASDYMLSDITIGVLPAYPKDLTKLMKPSIIVQKINTTIDSIGMGNVLGEYQDDTGIYDVYGKKHEIRTQLDVVAKDRTTSTLISSILSERLFNNIIKNYDGSYIPLNDYTNIKNPSEVGNISIVGDTDVVDLSPNVLDQDLNGNDDYRSVIRFKCRIIQPFVDETQGMVDLSKPLKWEKKIIL